MPTYNVNLYPIVRVLVRNVEADSQEEACRKAEKLAAFDKLFAGLCGPYVASIEYADDLDGFYVDEDGDTEHERSTGYDKEYRAI